MPRGLRYPFEPLEQQAAAQLGPRHTEGDSDRYPTGWTTSDLAAYLGVDKRTVYRWRETGLTFWQADKAAGALNLHPALIWPDWLHDSIARDRFAGTITEQEVAA